MRKLLHISHSKDVGSNSRSPSRSPFRPQEPTPEPQVDVSGPRVAEVVTESEGEVPDAGPQSARSKVGLFLKEKLEKGLTKSKIVIEHSLGLGHRPNAIPSDDANVNGEQRVVEIGWHPVGGLGGKWFAEKTGLGKKITASINKYPDPTQHWAVLVGDYAHELWMDENFDVIYINEKVVREEWHTFVVGKTRFNDEALRQAGLMTIHNMRQKRPAYNIISNNCQTFAVSMLDAIQIGAHREFATTFAIYQRATGLGEIKDLFIDEHPEEQTDQSKPELHRINTVQTAQHVMDAETTKLDNHSTFLYET